MSRSELDSPYCRPRSNGFIDGDGEGDMYSAAVQEELDHWLEVHRLLRQFGLQSSVNKLRSADHGSSFLLLDLPQSRGLRATLQTLMEDCDRRQALLQDIIVANTEMKSEVKRQSEMANRFERKAKDLKGLLEASRQRIEDLTEEKALSQVSCSTEAERQRNTKDVAVTKARQMEKRCEQQEVEIVRLRRKITKLTQEDANRQERQRELFRRLMRRPASQKASPMDDKMLDIIDAYERQLETLRRERDLLGGGGDGDAEVDKDVTDRQTESSINLRTLVKELQSKLQSSADVIAGLEEEKELLKLDLNSRPCLRDFNNAQVRLRRYEKLLRQHNVDVQAESRSERSGRLMVYSTDLADLDFLPLRQCRDYLRAVCQEMDVSNLDAIVLTAKEQRRMSAEYPNMVDFARRVDDIVQSPSAPPLPPAFTSPRVEGKEGPDETSDNFTRKSSSSDEPETLRRRQSLAVLEFWLDQLSALPELRDSLLRLYNHLFPWRTQPPEVGREVCAMVGLVDSLTDPAMEDHEYDDTGTSGVGPKTGKKQVCPENVARGLVTHFQRLFDCPRVSAVYTRMNDVYAKLSELRTLFSNIAQTLDLDPSAAPAHVFDAVTCLYRVQLDAGHLQLRQALDPDHIAKALEKLEQYDDFFPTFQQLVDELLQLLGLDDIDRIMPAVRSLKKCADVQ